MLRSSLTSNYPGKIATLTILVLEKIPILNNFGFLCQIDACLRGKLYWQGVDKAGHRMSKWSLKFVCQYFVMIATLDRMIATYTDHIKIMSYRSLKSMYPAANFKTLFLYVA